MKRLYGAGPGHLAAHVLLFALAGWAVLQLAGTGGALRVLIWFVAAVLLHDFVLLPLYSGADRLVARTGRRARATNFIRVPAVLSGALLLAFAPIVLGRGDAVLESVSGLEPAGYLWRWLAVSAVLFAASGALWAVRRRTA